MLLAVIILSVILVITMCAFIAVYFGMKKAHENEKSKMALVMALIYGDNLLENLRLEKAAVEALHDCGKTNEEIAELLGTKKSEARPVKDETKNKTKSEDKTVSD